MAHPIDNFSQPDAHLRLRVPSLRTCMGIVPIDEGRSGQILPEMQETQSQTPDGSGRGFDFQGLGLLRD